MDELYDLQGDPHELSNVAHRPEYRSVKRELYARMWATAAQTGDRIFSPYPTAALAEFGPLARGASWPERG